MGGDGDALDNNAIIVTDACCCMYDGCLFGDGCIGCMASETMCCLEMEFCCKQGAESLCCVCCAIRCVSPTVCIKSQGQMCCLAGAAAIPCDEEVPCMVGTCGIICYPTIAICKTLGDITGNSGIQCEASPKDSCSHGRRWRRARQQRHHCHDACCCMYDGCLFGDGCIGCMASETMCCLEMEFCCKQGAESLCCVCCAIRCVSPTVCIKSQGQMCCLAGAAAIPCDEEVPCMVGTCGIICYPTIAVCKTLGDITGNSGDGDALDNNAIIVTDACCCMYDGCLFGDGCIGCMASETMCCLEMEFCCKQGAESLCCVCCAIRCVSPTVCIKSQGQMCCLAGAAAIPCDEEVPCMVGTCGIICYPTIAICKTLGDITGNSGDGDALDNNAIIVTDACCCMYDGCLFGDGCIGCMASETMCCLEMEFCCKQGAESLCCVCCAIRCVSPTVCIKSQGQMCCLAGAAAIPCDEEVPCMVGTCGIICYPTIAICKTLGDITGNSGGDAPPAEQVG
ncbi:unnamed protein product [Prorocentrum cordatum]|uniref:Uncharacterized protein n=1 Tax=Prorocentrum cordatum TaxID=2364126 RepID=A0ABN9U1V2_9DINO|nr:unnamed protein product [Polarella glacialis]